MVLQDGNTHESLADIRCAGSTMLGEIALNNSQIINDFRAKVAEFAPDDCINDDVFLLRWLIAREFDLDKASFMLQNYCQWRNDSSIDTILDWEAPEDIRKSCPYEISGPDRDGRPILVFPWARWKSWDFTGNDRRDEYLKYMNQMLEKCVAAIKPPATQFIILADSDGFSFRHMSRLKALEVNLEALKGFESHYPEMMKMAFVVNCPKVFSILYSVIKPLMSSRTQEKLKIHDYNDKKWGKALEDLVVRENLPVRYRVKHDLSNLINNDDDVNSDSSSGDQNSIEIQR